MGTAIKLALTAAQAGVIDWALGPMYDFWCDEHGAHERGSDAVYDEDQLPKLSGLELTLSPVLEINSDLLYRVEVQMVDMATYAKKPATVAMCRRLSVRLREYDRDGLGTLPHGGGWLESGGIRGIIAEIMELKKN